MKILNIRKYAGMTSLVTSGAMILCGCGYSVVGQNLNTGSNYNGYSNVSKYYIEPSSCDIEETSVPIIDNNDDVIYDSTKDKYSDIIENTECNNEVVTTECTITESVTIETMTECDDIIYDSSIDKPSSDVEPYAYSGQNEYMNNVTIIDDIDSIRGKIIHATGFSGASNNFIVFDEGSCNPGFNVVTYFMNDGNGNYTSRVLCVCAKRIDSIDGIPVIYLRDDNDVLDVVKSKGLSTDKIRISDLYSKILFDFPVNVDEYGNQFITYNGMVFNKEYMKTR